MKEIKIEKGIPIPERNSCCGYTNALRKMKVGDSILVPPTSRMAAYTGAGRVGIKVVTRKEGEMIRIWRVERKDT